MVVLIYRGNVPANECTAPIYQYVHNTVLQCPGLGEWKKKAAAGAKEERKHLGLQGRRQTPFVLSFGGEKTPRARLNS